MLRVAVNCNGGSVISLQQLLQLHWHTLPHMLWDQQACNKQTQAPRLIISRACLAV